VVVCRVSGRFFRYLNGKYGSRARTGRVMRRPFVSLYVHLVWATWNRLPLLTDATARERVYRCILREAERLGCPAEAIGGVADHVHLVLRISPTVTIASVVKQVKGASSHLIRRDILPDRDFRWQGAYGAFSIGKRDLPRLLAYVRDQERRHHNGRVDPLLEAAFTEG
jgi:putative transposase